MLLWIIAFAVVFMLSYKAAELVQDLWQQRTMNNWRKELDLPVKPLTIRTLSRV